MSSDILSRGFEAVGFNFGRLMSRVLSLGHKVVGPVLDWWISTPVQRVAFVGFARVNALYVTLACMVTTSVFAWLNPRSDLATVLLLTTFLPLQSMYFRLNRGKVSMIVTSCYGRELRVHLPDTCLQPRDVAALRAQVEELMRIASVCRARTLTFNSPLLAAKSTSTLLARALARAAASASANARVEVEEPREVHVISHGNLSVYANRYEALRDGRLAVGARGRLMSRKMQVQFK
ncbi:hypothetical protein AQ916_23040 [Burkholderia pseudomallei]|uniref:hypothetical protein n=1 Tax=Burkholderia pseudomallei TaxID=28450 RepID=UPI000978A440|nr:hypothetical protein [Burkholderia pseudomallei]ONC31300.1 hypothetical protein AQ916_23040 [Burkholderia pseudomallei]